MTVYLRGFDNFWPPYTPHMNPYDLYIWGYLKSRVYTDPIPETCEQLKKNIKREIRRTNSETLATVYDDVLVRHQKCIGQEVSVYSTSLITYDMLIRFSAALVAEW